MGLRDKLLGKVKDKFKENFHKKLVEIRDGSAWFLLHPWERDFIEGKLNKGWRQWTNEESIELSQLMVDISKRLG